LVLYLAFFSIDAGEVWITRSVNSLKSFKTMREDSPKTTLEWFGNGKTPPTYCLTVTDCFTAQGATTFRLKTKGLTIFLDTWLERPTVLPKFLSIEEVPEADYIFISHAHFDQ
jgi:hypothetical protein